MYDEHQAMLARPAEFVYERGKTPQAGANELSTNVLSQLPETWSVLTRLASSPGLSQIQSSQAACMFIRGLV